MEFLQNLPWLNEGFSNYVTFFLGIGVGIVATLLNRYLSRKHPAILQVTKVDSSRMLVVADKVKNSITITYKGNAIDYLEQTTFWITNQGEEHINNIKINIELKTQSDIDPILIDPLRQNQITYQTIPDDTAKKVVVLEIPYINPIKEHRDRIVLEVYSIESMTVTSVSGSGPGWSTSYIDKSLKESDLIDILTEPLGVVAIRQIAGFVTKFVTWK